MVKRRLLHLQGLLDFGDDVRGYLMKITLDALGGPLAPGHFTRAHLGPVADRQGTPEVAQIVVRHEVDLSDVEPAESGVLEDVVQRESVVEDRLQRLVDHA